MWNVSHDLVTNNRYNHNGSSLPEHGSLIGAHGEAFLEGAREVGAVVTDWLDDVEQHEADNKQDHSKRNPHAHEDILGDP